MPRIRTYQSKSGVEFNLIVYDDNSVGVEIDDGEEPSAFFPFSKELLKDLRNQLNGIVGEEVNFLPVSGHDFSKGLG